MPWNTAQLGQKAHVHCSDNSQKQCSHVIQTQARKLWWMHIDFLMLFTKVVAHFHTKIGKHKLQISASLRSDARYFDALTHNVYFCAYSVLQNTLKIPLSNLWIWFGSSEDQRLNQSWSTAVIPGWARREERLRRTEYNQPFWIDSDAVLHMNLWTFASKSFHVQIILKLWLQVEMIKLD